jgi:hypothetical protein
MLSLFQNPLLRFMARMWWLPALTLIVVGFVLFKEDGLRIAVSVSAALFAALAGLIFSAWLHGVLAAFRKSSDRRASDYRFLCPQCLRFGDFDFGCGSCGVKINPFIVNTQGAYTIKCPHCRSALYAGEKENIAAYCRRCDASCEMRTHHHRQIRVVGALLTDDFHHLRGEGEEKRSADGLRYACTDDGRRLTYILNLEDLAARGEGTSAIREMKTIWVGADCDALVLGEAADRFITKARLTDAERKRVTISIPQRELEATSLHVLETRFGQLKRAMTASMFLSEANEPVGLGISRGPTVLAETEKSL